MINLVEAHKHSSKHNKEINKSVLCGCFYCLKTFPPQDIKDWIDGGETAKCPFCDIDSVIGDASGFPLTESFLKEMQVHWF